MLHMLHMLCMLLMFPFSGALQSFNESRFYYDTAKDERFETMQHPGFIPTYGPLPVTDPTGEELCKGSDGTINQFCYDDYIMSGKNADLAKNTRVSYEDYHTLHAQIGKLSTTSVSYCCSLSKVFQPMLSSDKRNFTAKLCKYLKGTI